MRKLSEFQRRARLAIEAVLAQHAADAHFMEGRDADGRPWLSARFLFANQEHEIEIFADSVTMSSGKQLFEPYLRHEFTDDETEIESFTERLERYLRGGSWEGDGG